MKTTSFGKDLRNSFFAGLLVIAPLAASLGILWWLFNTVTDWLLPHKLQTFGWRVVSLVVFVSLVTMIGWVTRLVVGKRLVALTETIIRRVPLLNRIYGFMKDVSDTMLSGKKGAFQQVVMVEYPRRGVYMVGFLTSVTGGEAQAKTTEQLVNVFIPTTPNPTSGYLALVPREQVRELEMSVADGMKMVISGGTVVPPYPVLTSAPPVVPPPAQ